MQKFLPGKWVALIYRSTQMFINNELAGTGIGAGQYPFLLYIGRCSGQTQDEISKSLCFDKGTTARAIKRLEKAGYIRREVSETDHRKNHVFITKTGARMRLKIRAMLEDWHKKLFVGISDEMRDEISERLQQMATQALSQVRDGELPRDIQES